MTSIINNSNSNQWTLQSVNRTSISNNQFTQNYLNLEDNLIKQLHQKIFFISPYIYDLLESNQISLNTAKLKANNLYVNLSTCEKKIIHNKLLQLKIHDNFDISKLNLIHPTY